MKAMSADHSGAGSPPLYEQIGGMEACEHLSQVFHKKVAGDAVLRPLFPGDLAPSVERLALFLAQHLGGPPIYTASRGKTSLICRHAHLAIGSVEANAWLQRMFESIDEVGLADPGRKRLRDLLTETAATLADPLLPYYSLPIDALRALLMEAPHLARTVDHGRSLLRKAAMNWQADRIQLLLEAGAEADTADLLGHAPLYHAAMAGSTDFDEEEGCAAVRLLIRYGADVNRQSGPGRSDALHAAARRGYVGIAQVLLEAGADIDQRDSKGETPLRRAANCGREGMALLLLARGADPVSRDRQGRTPLDTVRNEKIRQALIAHGKTWSGSASKR